MNFNSPWSLLLLLLVPLFAALYLLILRRKRRSAVRFSSLALIREALPKQSLWRRHLPFALFLAGLGALALATARPTAAVEVPLSRTTIILALDVSRSMCSTDILPNRLAVAQEAAKAFVAEQAGETRIGIVAFAGFAELIVPPTNDSEGLQEAIDNFTTSVGTAIGSATLKSIDAIAEVNDAVAPSGVDLQSDDAEADSAPTTYQPDIIVLLTDGANSRGPEPLEAAQVAANRGIRVYTVGFGTENPREMVCSRQQLGSDAFNDGFGNGFGGGFGGGGGGGFDGNFRRFLLIDEDTLQGVADLTGGEYFRAENADQLLDVFLKLPNQFVLQKEAIEISALFAALGAVFVLVAVALSLYWNRTT